jgi:hypothetical protein
MKKIWGALGTIIFFVVIVIAGGLGDAGGKLASSLLLGPTHKQLVAQAAKEINKKLPMMIDAETRMDVAIAAPDGTLLTYDYTLVNYDARSINAAGLIALENQVTNTTCSQKTTNLLNKNVALEFRYKSSDGQLVKAFTIRPQKCAHDLLSNSTDNSVSAATSQYKKPPSFESEGWTQESTGSRVSGPWLDNDPAGTRYSRLADGTIYRLFPPGARPNAEKANPFALGDSTDRPPSNQ